METPGFAMWKRYANLFRDAQGETVEERLDATGTNLAR